MNFQRFRRDTDLETKVKAYANTDGSRGASVQQDLYKNDNGRVYAHGGIDHQPGFGNQKQAGVAAEFTFGRWKIKFFNFVVLLWFVLAFKFIEVAK